MDLQIPGYKILGVLGRGGMATVYLAEQDMLEREVALKVMSRHLAEDPAFGQRFLREAKIVSRLLHPHIVTVHDVGVHNGAYYLAMQYVDGPDLKQAARDLPLTEIIRIVEEIGAALHYASNKGYVHRDIKPENIMLSAVDMRAVLTDFGIARAAEGDIAVTQTGIAVGTPHYMSPEQARGQPVDGRTDLYSLGVVFYYLLTGEVPYQGDSAVAIGIKHITEAIPRLPPALACLQPMLDKLLAKTPAERYQNAAQLIDALNRLNPAVIERAEQKHRQIIDSLPRENSREAHPSEPAITGGRAQANTVQANTAQANTAQATQPRLAAISDEDLPDGSTRQAQALPEDELRPDWAEQEEQADEAYPEPPPVERQYPLKNPDTQRGNSWETAEEWDEAPDEWEESQEPAGSRWGKGAVVVLLLAVFAAAAWWTVGRDAFQPQPNSPQQTQGGMQNATIENGSQPLGALSRLGERLRSFRQSMQAPAVQRTFAEEVGYQRGLLKRNPNDPEVKQALLDATKSQLWEINRLLDAAEYRQARQQFAQLQTLVPEFARDEQLAVEERLERSTQIQSLVADGEQLLARGRGLVPEDDNAYMRFREVLVLDSKNEPARRAVEKIMAELVASARQQYLVGDWEDALVSTEKALTMDPSYEPALKLKEQIQQLSQSSVAIRTLISKAYQQIQRGHLFTPDKYSAYAFFQQALAEPLTAEQAKHGLNELRLAFVQRIDGYLNQKKYDEAEKEVELALQAVPGDELMQSALTELQARVQERRQTAP